ncbi:MAG: tRNA (guanosine(46)-N7)-methyltransferase TrmB [Sphaerochaetaceae bacterium]|jgi:tRNA (guanine-N7-)-methyltransferase|nr:tRNA (guanosine(46)-N7)-methyltransferase TrmB [Sphaerochaetaceae bacterium]NLO61506.1 tRNA (guanosine(46)-N7)-methyltransferase TrmB [Spirochaetales bacterium]MDD2404886.1 tRNA (guanosine(46)-N7)-methyltransferase TrmB [Sphaerochaetaceae bacterium]MDD3670939.1 tRNA (guanosine(46)-N7)-methyltransferase TrmB [Sphaerochaetaceae bacterium]MDD4763358.1 tRNA (guanosine(46)-N7)-methyltransferase TrmB [Sphaerochaetaceae bacterium]
MMERERVETLPADKKRSVKSFVLRSSRLASFQIEALEHYSDQYAIRFSGQKIDYGQLFNNNNPIIIEIGFGMGQATFELAKRFPDKNFIGIEVFLNGFAKLLHQVGSNDIQNLRLIRFDAVEVLESMIPDASIEGFHIFFPDPWPKKKHFKRRLIQEPVAKLLSTKLVKNGYVYCVTDWEPYGLQMLEVFDKIPEFTNPYNGFADPVEWRPTTSFERKGLAKQHPICEVWVQRI